MPRISPRFDPFELDLLLREQEESAAVRERRWARGRPVHKPRNTPAVMRVRFSALEAWNASMDEKLAKLEAASLEIRK